MQGITMSGITKDFLGKLALQDVDITFKKGTVHAIVGVNAAGDQMMLVSLFDNLGKGSSGAAVQCMNLMLGLEETKGLE